MSSNKNWTDMQSKSIEWFLYDWNMKMWWIELSIQKKKTFEMYHYVANNWRCVITVKSWTNDRFILIFLNNRFHFMIISCPSLPFSDCQPNHLYARKLWRGANKKTFLLFTFISKTITNTCMAINWNCLAEYAVCQRIERQLLRC